jgi:hypothetical protein
LAPAGPTKTSPIYANHRTSVTLAFAVDKRVRWRWPCGSCRFLRRLALFASSIDLWWELHYITADKLFSFSLASLELIRHGIIFFSHNKSASAGLSAAETISRTVICYLSLCHNTIKFCPYLPIEIIVNLSL